MPVLVHGLFVASLAFPRSLLVARRRRRVPACDAGLIATNPHGTFPSSPPPLPPPSCPPSSTSSLCSRCSATSRHPQRGSVAVSRQPQEPIVWNIERNPRAHVDGSPQCGHGRRTVSVSSQHHRLSDTAIPPSTGRRASRRLHPKSPRCATRCGLHGIGLLEVGAITRASRNPAPTPKPPCPRCELAVGSAPEPSTTLT